MSRQTLMANLIVSDVQLRDAPDAFIAGEVKHRLTRQMADALLDEVSLHPLIAGKPTYTDYPDPLASRARVFAVRVPILVLDGMDTNGDIGEFVMEVRRGA